MQFCAAHSSAMCYYFYSRRYLRRRHTYGRLYLGVNTGNIWRCQSQQTNSLSRCIDVADRDSPSQQQLGRNVLLSTCAFRTTGDFYGGYRHSNLDTHTASRVVTRPATQLENSCTSLPIYLQRPDFRWRLGIDPFFPNGSPICPVMVLWTSFSLVALFHHNKVVCILGCKHNAFDRFRFCLLLWSDCCL
jgi:hypothetical protein